MAKDSPKTAAPAANTNPETPATVQETKYQASEFIACANTLLGYSPDVVRAAFRFTGVKECTLANARVLVKNFAERKVN